MPVELQIIPFCAPQRIDTEIPAAAHIGYARAHSTQGQLRFVSRWAAYAGHIDSGSEAGATSTYVRASLPEVAAALAALTGEPHPPATAEGW